MKYSASLDGMRAVAALTVLAFHAKVPGFSGGFFGVDLFFVLSGYLITRILREEHEGTGDIKLLRFYGRRIGRLYPALIVMLLAYIALAPALFPQQSGPSHLQDAALAAIYLTDYSRWFGAPVDLLGHTWSLSVEEQFYLVWPLILLMLVRLPARHAIFILVGMYIAATAWRLENLIEAVEHRVIYERLDTHATGLILGCLIGYVSFTIHRAWGLVAIAGLAYCVATFRFLHTDTLQNGMPLAELLSAMLVLSRPEWLAGPVLQWLGRMSYGLYLWHYPIMRWMRAEEWEWPETMLFGSLLGLAAAAASYYLIECRFRDRKTLPAATAYR